MTQSVKPHLVTIRVRVSAAFAAWLERFLVAWAQHAQKHPRTAAQLIPFALVALALSTPGVDAPEPIVAEADAAIGAHPGRRRKGQAPPEQLPLLSPGDTPTHRPAPPSYGLLEHIDVLCRGRARTTCEGRTLVLPRPGAVGMLSEADVGAALFAQGWIGVRTEHNTVRLYPPTARVILELGGTLLDARTGEAIGAAPKPPPGPVSDEGLLAVFRAAYEESEAYHYHGGTYYPSPEGVSLGLAAVLRHVRGPHGVNAGSREQPFTGVRTGKVITALERAASYIDTASDIIESDRLSYDEADDADAREFANSLRELATSLKQFNGKSAPMQNATVERIDRDAPTVTEGAVRIGAGPAGDVSKPFRDNREAITNGAIFIDPECLACGRVGCNHVYSRHARGGHACLDCQCVSFVGPGAEPAYGMSGGRADRCPESPPPPSPQATRESQPLEAAAQEAIATATDLPPADADQGPMSTPTPFIPRPGELGPGDYGTDSFGGEDASHAPAIDRSPLTYDYEYGPGHIERPTMPDPGLSAFKGVVIDESTPIRNRPDEYVNGRGGPTQAARDFRRKANAKLKSPDEDDTPRPKKPKSDGRKAAREAIAKTHAKRGKSAKKGGRT